MFMIPTLHSNSSLKSTHFEFCKKNFMDKEQPEIDHSLDFYGIFRESFTIILSWRKLFSQITIATIFPLFLLFLGHLQISEFLFANIVHNEEGFFQNPNTIWDTFWSEEIAFWLFKIVYVVIFLVLSLVSTSAVVYTVACFYTRKEISFAEVMCVVPEIWKRLMVTFAWSLIIVLVYNMAAFSLLVPWFGSIDGLNTARLAISGPLLLIYVMGFVYISIIWHLACVVSILEEDCGIEAMIKSQALMRGKMVISVVVFLLLNLCFILIQVVYNRVVILGEVFWSRIGCGLLCFLLLSGFTLLGLIIQTVIYLICKSYHHEVIDKLCLVTHLEVYLGGYAPLRFKDVQLDQF